MYQELVNAAHNSNIKPRRHFVALNEKLLVADDPVYPSAFRYKPDFAVVERSAHLPVSKSIYWRQCPSFMEVKAKDSESPIPSQILPVPADATAPSPAVPTHLMPSPLDASVAVRPPVKNSLVQAADYARSILTCRPFQMFVYGLIQWGVHFAVGMFDRRGIALSPQLSIDDPVGLATFVRVVLRITHDMSELGLGRDPSAILDGADTLDDPRTFPRFVIQPAVGMIGDNTDYWMTIGEPLWCSHSLLGRGTSVWRAIDSKKRPVILKTSLRSTKRRGEREIYRAIVHIFGGPSSLPRGMIQCGDVTGGDVVMPEQWHTTSQWYKLSVDSMRRLSSLASPSPSGDAILHRVAFYDFGKPLWRFNCPEQLIRATRMAVAGECDDHSSSRSANIHDGWLTAAHKELEKRGILHRDISAGNILIRVKPFVDRLLTEITHEEYPVLETEGFLSDFEFALLPSSYSENGDNQSHKGGITVILVFVVNHERLSLIRLSGNHHVHRDQADRGDRDTID